MSTFYSIDVFMKSDVSVHGNIKLDLSLLLFFSPFAAPE